MLSSEFDALKKSPLKVSLQTQGDKPVKSLIFASLAKCSEALQIDLSKSQAVTLIEDIIEVYEWDSVEDILQAFKLGRQGVFGTTFKQLNMIIFREWMAHVLDQKAALREKAKHDQKKAESKPVKEFDRQAYYENYLRVEREKKEQENKKSLSQMQYEAKKHEYFNKKKNG